MRELSNFLPSVCCATRSVVVAPRHIEREWFFYGSKDGILPFQQLLVKQPRVAEVQPVPDAYVPVIKFTIAGIQVCFITRPSHVAFSVSENGISRPFLFC